MKIRTLQLIAETLLNTDLDIYDDTEMAKSIKKYTEDPRDTIYIKQYITIVLAQIMLDNVVEDNKSYFEL